MMCHSPRRKKRVNRSRKPSRMRMAAVAYKTKPADKPRSPRHLTLASPEAKLTTTITTTPVPGTSHGTSHAEETISTTTMTSVTTTTIRTPTKPSTLQGQGMSWTVPGKQFITEEYALKCKHPNKSRKFPCGTCTSTFNTQREVNDHFHSKHPPVKCNDCDCEFSTPVSMLKHRYSHH